MSFSNSPDGVFEGIKRVVDLTPQAVIVVDAVGDVLLANDPATCLVPEVARPAANLFRDSTDQTEAARRRLAEILKSNQPALFRLELFSGQDVLFRVRRLAVSERAEDVCAILFEDSRTPMLDKFADRAVAQVVSHQRLQDAKLRQFRLHREAMRLRRLSETDDLTGLLNARAFEAQVESALRHGEGGVLVFVDLDDFKAINDAFGHDAGDLALKIAARRLQRGLRAKDRLARVGGDEFTVWLPGQGPADAEAVLHRLDRAITGPVRLSGPVDAPRPYLAASLGSACAPDDGDSFSALKKAADARMYGNKARDVQRRVPVMSPVRQK